MRVPLISLRDQRDRARIRLVGKQQRRKGLNSRGKHKGSPYGYNQLLQLCCPYHGKDRFSGQMKKFSERILVEHHDTGRVVRLYVYDNSKYKPRIDNPERKRREI